MKTPVFTIRLRPEYRALLDRAAAEERRSRASLIEEALREYLAPRYADIEDRLAAMGVKA